MLNTIHITGFRSLNDFSLSIKSGLNVLVGPNGSGKTNIINALEFISIFIQQDLISAIYELGGVNNVFSREKSGQRQIAIKLHGVFQPSKTSGPVDYFYIMSCSFNEETAAATVEKESITITGQESFGSLSISVSHNGGPTISVEDKISDEGRRLGGPDYISRRSTSLEEDFQFLLPLTEGVRTLSLFSLARRIFSPLLSTVAGELYFGRAYNILPFRARQPDEISQVSGVRPDGTGLSATLSRLAQRKNENTGRKRKFNFPGAENFSNFTLKEITALCGLINPHIQGIEASPQLDQGKHTCILRYGTPQSTINLPLSSASDGIVKWLALVTALYSGAAILGVEEPENFLHPHMQREFIGISRLYALRSRIGFLLISSHSETLINACEPGELVITNFISGETRAKRIESPEAVVEEINKTGFGLAYYYSSGVFDT